jgi:hypothetical protein
MDELRAREQETIGAARCGANPPSCRYRRGETVLGGTHALSRRYFGGLTAAREECHW